eukprot:GHVN01028220.1.p2 GENE.GHVN01028220.1~~GHVN01028220.1.p2  ORF type:complete len:629 (+),score=97.13 GHVN01028220.1:5096-6982(+)
MGNGCQPFSDESWTPETAMERTGRPLEKWQDCLRLCTGFPGWRANQFNCQYWTYYETDYKGPHHESLAGTCQIFPNHGLFCRRPGWVGAHAGTRFSGSRDDCSATCVMSEWTDWTQCSQTCGGEGSRERERTRLHSPSQDEWFDTYEVHNTPLEVDKLCAADEKQTEECGKIPCPIDCEWAEWEPLHPTDEWINSPTVCDKTCGGSYAHRYRDVLVHGAHGGSMCNDEDRWDEIPCNTHPCPGCDVTAWSEWSSCSVSCESGHRTRTREKEHPDAWLAECDDLVNLSEDIHCTAGGEHPIICEHPCELAEDWTPWSPCTHPCGTGVAIRTKQIIEWHRGPTEKTCGTVYIDESGKEFDYRFEEVGPCNAHPCPVDCEQTEWSDWSDCAAPPCTGGFRSTTRKVITHPEGDGEPCGENYLTESCVSPPKEGEECKDGEEDDCFSKGQLYEGDTIATLSVPTMSECQGVCFNSVANYETECAGFSYDFLDKICAVFSSVTEVTETEDTVLITSGPPDCDAERPIFPSVPGTGEPLPGEEGGKGGAIAGAAVGAVALLALIGGCGLYVAKRSATPEFELEEYDDVDDIGMLGDDRHVIQTRDFAEEGRDQAHRETQVQVEDSDEDQEMDED